MMRGSSRSEPKTSAIIASISCMPPVFATVGEIWRTMV